MKWWMDESMNGWWMDGWMDGWTNGYGYGYCCGCMSTLQLIQLLQKKSIIKLQQYLHHLLLQVLHHCYLNENGCIVTKGGIYCEIWPQPEGNPEGRAWGISLGLRLYFTVHPFSRHNTDTIYSWLHCITLQYNTLHTTQHRTTLYYILLHCTIPYK